MHFRHSKKKNVVDTGIENAGTGSVTIPLNYATINDKKIETNKGLFEEKDYIVEGEITKEFNYKTLQKENRIFLIKSIDDNRKGGLQHYLIGVGE